MRRELAEHLARRLGSHEGAAAAAAPTDKDVPLGEELQSASRRHPRHAERRRELVVAGEPFVRLQQPEIHREPDPDGGVRQDGGMGGRRDGVKTIGHGRPRAAAIHRGAAAPLAALALPRAVPVESLTARHPRLPDELDIAAIVAHASRPRTS